MSASTSFLNDVLSHLTAFATSKGVKPDDVFVRITLADNSSFAIIGLKTTAPAVIQGLGMIQGSSDTAVIVREAHVIKAEFDLAPETRPPIGLHTELAPAR